MATMPKYGKKKTIKRLLQNQWAADILQEAYGAPPYVK